MKLTIKLYAGLTCRNPELPHFDSADFQIEVPNGTTVEELHRHLGFDPRIPLLNMVNNVGRKADCLLYDGDRVAMFPPIGGG